MTDREALKAMLAKSKIPFGENASDVDAENDKFTAPLEPRSITVEVEGHRDDSPLVGYNGFVAVFHFNEAGDLVKMGIWE